MRTKELLQKIERDTEYMKKQISDINDKYTQILWDADYPTCLSRMDGQQLLDMDKIIGRIWLLRLLKKLVD